MVQLKIIHQNQRVLGQLKLILNMKTFITEKDETAADFLEKLDEKSSNNRSEDKPELPI